MFNIVYDSRTGQVERFVQKIKIQTSWLFFKLTADLFVDQPFHFLTYTDKEGETPETSQKFLDCYGQYLLSVGSSGNKNWGEYRFAKAADNICSQYNVPLSLKFELAGNQKDVHSFIHFIKHCN